MWQLHWRNEVNLIPNASQRQLKILIQSGQKLSDWKEKGQNLFYKQCIIRITFTDSSEGEHRKTVILRYMHICINIIYIIKMGNRYPLFLGKNYDIRYALNESWNYSWGEHEVQKWMHASYLRHLIFHIQFTAHGSLNSLWV